MENHDFDAAIVHQTTHRPWPVPARPWVMTQTWHDLLFAHWPVPPAAIRPLVPPVFELDVIDGDAWLAIVPFRMTNVAPRGVPSLPWLSRFPEINVRTYVRDGGRPGVYFFSLDARRAAAVHVARALLNLPYHTAAMRVTRMGDSIEYRSRRRSDASAEFHAVYEPAGPPVAPVRGSLEWFLTERYCLYHVDRQGAPYRLEIHHPPWPLQPARARVVRNTMAGVNGVHLPDRPPLLHFAGRQDVVAWAPVRLRGA